MRPWSVSVLSVLLLGTTFFSPNSMCQAPQNASPISSSTPEYSDSEAGLKKLLENIFAAMTANDESKISSYLSGLKIPDHGAWFAKVFGPEEGARLEAKYTEMLPEESNQIRKIFDNALKDQRTTVDVHAIHKFGEIMGLWHAVMYAMVQPTTLYGASSRNPNQKVDVVLGDFVYIDGGFHFVDIRVWQSLSNAPPLRIRQGGNVTVRSLIQRVAPAYPEEARAAHTQGTIRLHIIIATDGTVKEITPMQGDPVLTKSALEAVRQWKYHPTLLNGTPVEVDTTVDVIFEFR